MLNRLFVVCFFFFSFTAAATASIPVTDTSPRTIAPRVALVVGNTRYHSNPLRTSSADANAIAGLLRDRGFDVIQIENASFEILEQALLELNARLGETGTGLFYFAGHGLQTAESVLLLPVDTDSTSLDTMQRTALSVDRIIRQMSLGRPGQPNLLIIDSCLNNPYQLSARTRPGVGHLPELPAETLIAFATAPGAVAYEGMEQQGIYAQALMNALGKPGLDASTVFDDVQHTVRVRTRNQQVPWVLSSLDSPLLLSPDSVQAREAFTTSHHPGVLSLAQLTAMPTRGILPKDGDAQYELEFWQSIKNSTDAADYEAYLEAYPDGKFAPLAKSRAQRYKKSTPEPDRQPAFVVNELDDQYEVIRNANMRQTPSSKSRRLAELQSGSSVHVTGQLADKQWYQVRFAGMTGYIYAELLRKPVAKPAPKAKPAPEPKPKPIARPTPQPVKVLPVRPGKIEEIRDCPSCPVMLALPAGNFTMGASRGDRSEKPAHKVSINKPFAIGKYEVTVAQWNECHTAGACSYKPDFDPQENSPIRDISWSDAREYTKWLSTVTQKPYRLPTEAEWEYAARGGTDTTYWWGNEVGTGQADCKNCGGKWNKKSPAAVDAFPANPFGLYGTSGGVWEWVADCWHKTYKGAPKDGTAWSRNDCRENVIRGGAWRNDASYIHSASRFKYDTHVRYLLNGFRVARTLP